MKSPVVVVAVAVLSASVALPGCAGRGVTVRDPEAMSSAMAPTGSPRCSVVRLVHGDRARALPGGDVLPAAPSSTAGAGVLQVSPDRDAADPVLCPERFTRTVRCADVRSWGDPHPADFVRAFRADGAYVVHGFSYARAAPPVPGADAAESDGPELSFVYTTYELAHGDPEGAIPFLRGAFATCGASRRPSPAGAPDVELVATTWTVGGTTSDVALLVRGERVAVLTLAGKNRTWAPAERAHAWSVAASYLRDVTPSPPRTAPPG